MRKPGILEWRWLPSGPGPAESKDGEPPQAEAQSAPLRKQIVPLLVLTLAICVAEGGFVWSFGRAGEGDGSQAITLSATAKGPAVRAGSPAPNRLLSFDGVPVALESYLGQPVWITFWASWCPPCRAESPELVAAYERHAADGLVMIAVDVGEKPAVVAEYVERAALPFLILMDQSTAVAAQYRVLGLPTHFFVDRDGVLREVKIGPMSTKEIERRLATILLE